MVVSNTSPLSNLAIIGRLFPVKETHFILLLLLLAGPVIAETAVTGVSPFSGGMPPPPGYQLVWSDEFNGTALDTSKWDYRTDSKMWSKQKVENVSVSNGLLKLTLKREEAGKKHYTGAGIVSNQIFRFGYYEARVKAPAGAGWHTSF